MTNLIDEAAKKFNELMFGKHGEKWKNYLRTNPAEISKSWRKVFEVMTLREFDDGMDLISAGKFGSKIPTPVQFFDLVKSTQSEIQRPEEELSRGCGLPITDTDIVQPCEENRPNLKSITLVRDCDDDEIDDPYKKEPVHIKESPGSTVKLPNFLQYVTAISAYPDGCNYNENRAIEAAKKILEKLKNGDTVEAHKCDAQGCKNHSLGDDMYKRKRCYLHFS